jgi:hypothetical protein
MKSRSHDRTSELNRVIGLCQRIFDEYRLNYVEAVRVVQYMLIDILSRSSAPDIVLKYIAASILEKTLDPKVPESSETPDTADAEHPDASLTPRAVH